MIFRANVGKDAIHGASGIWTYMIYEETALSAAAAAAAAAAAGVCRFFAGFGARFPRRTPRS